ncbi:MAG: tRNA (adenine-N1)-methyltransferase [Deltaproteobacteria bacterium]|jgi:tRNA (adenine57-N1/adenine58-N1)-methyltransferase|nr:tRNA (adenine-N1)-methyltransferase [Deltaproteobacteria bacterium]
MPAYGELVILLSPKGRKYLRRLEPGVDIHGEGGVLAAADIAAADFGGEVLTHLGAPFRLLRPGLYDLVRGVRRQTQVLYPKDIGYICLRLGVGRGSRIIEAGSGSGALTLALSWFSGENGRVYSYESREEFYKLCRRNLDWAGLGANVTQHCRDIAEGFLETGADALFLDVRTPWAYLDQAAAALRPGGCTAFLLPTTGQVEELLLGLERGDFAEVEVEELLLRRWKPLPDRLRPDDRMVAHTGFLVFARKQRKSEAFEQAAPKGTRERKQDAARLGRLADE